MNDIPLWEEITREERYFCSFLFHDIRNNPAPFIALLRDEGLPTSPESKIIDVGYEVCYFRDMAKWESIEPPARLRKQTFDIVVWTADKQMLIVEAKAHGGFTRKQVHNLDEARDLIQRGQIENAKNVRLIALASSAYLNRWKIAKRFDQAIAWSAVAAAYGAHREIYLRADDVYKDGKYAPARQLANYAHP